MNRYYYRGGKTPPTLQLGDELEMTPAKASIQGSTPWIVEFSGRIVVESYDAEAAAQADLVLRPDYGRRVVRIVSQRAVAAARIVGTVGPRPDQPVLRVDGLFEIRRALGGGFLGRLVGAPELGDVYIPTLTTGFVVADTERGMPTLPAGARYIVVAQLKGPARWAREIKVFRGEKGLRAEGWGGLRVIRAYSSLSAEDRAAAEADVRANSVEVLRAFGLARLANEKEAEARRAEEARLAEEARRKAEAEARRLAEEAARAAEEARLRAEEEARLRAEEDARRQAEELPRRLGISLEAWAAMSPKAQRLAAHRARLAGKL